MSVRIRLVPVVSLLLGLMGLGCAPPHRAPFLIASPHDNDTFPSGQPVTVRVDTIDLTHVNGETWESYDYEVFDNGDLVARRTHVPLTNRNPYEVIAHPADGLHWVDVNGRIARTRYFFGDPEPVYSDRYALNVCFWVGPNPPPDFCSVRTIVQAARVATPTPTRVPPTPTPVPVILEAEAFPNPLYYGETCPSLSSVTLRAALAVPEGMTAQQLDVKAHVSVMVGTSSGNVGGLVVPLEATQTWDVSTGGQEFEGTLDLSHAYDRREQPLRPGGDGRCIRSAAVVRGRSLLRFGVTDGRVAGSESEPGDRSGTVPDAGSAARSEARRGLSSGRAWNRLRAIHQPTQLQSCGLFVGPADVPSVSSADSREFGVKRRDQVGDLVSFVSSQH